MKSRELISLELDRDEVLGKLDEMLKEAPAFSLAEATLGQLRNDVVRAFAKLEAAPKCGR